MFKLLMVFLGGGLGASFRYGAGLAAEKFLGMPHAGTFTVNILGSLIIGFILAYQLNTNNSLSHNLLAFLTIGFLGGFTTFSTYSYESFRLFESKEYLHFFIYAFMSPVLGVLAAISGIHISKMFS